MWPPRLGHFHVCISFPVIFIFWLYGQWTVLALFKKLTLQIARALLCCFMQTTPFGDSILLLGTAVTAKCENLTKR